VGRDHEEVLQETGLDSSQSMEVVQNATLVDVRAKQRQSISGCNPRSTVSRHVEPGCTWLPKMAGRLVNRGVLVHRVLHGLGHMHLLPSGCHPMAPEGHRMRRMGSLSSTTTHKGCHRKCAN